jgi:hypothetical protein
MGEKPLQRLLAILGPEMATRNTYVHKITNIAVFYTAHGLNEFDRSKSITRVVGRGGPL